MTILEIMLAALVGLAAAIIYRLGRDRDLLAKELKDLQEVYDATHRNFLDQLNKEAEAFTLPEPVKPKRRSKKIPFAK